MREREVEADRLIWVIPAKIKKEGESNIYLGTFKRYVDRFEFHHHNGATTHKFTIPLVDHKNGKTYMKFISRYDERFTVFFESHDLHLAMSDNY